MTLIQRAYGIEDLADLSFYWQCLWASNFKGTLFKDYFSTDSEPPMITLVRKKEKHLVPFVLSCFTLQYVTINIIHSSNSDSPKLE